MAGQITGRFIGDFSSFNDAVNKAVVHLQGMETGASKVQTSLDKMVNQFSGRKIIQDAELMGKTFELLAEKGIGLTNSELQRMGRVAEEAMAKLKASGEPIPPEIQKITDAFKASQAAGITLKSTFGDLVTQVKATALGFVSAQAIIGTVQTGFRTLVGFVTDSVDAFAASEAATRKLTTALMAQGTAVPEVTTQYQALATSFQDTTVFADELITEMQALLVQVGDVMPADMERALTAATDLASGLGIDLRTATMLVGKAFEGETGTLKKYGIVIDETKLKTEGVTAVLDAVQEKFGGQAQSEAESYAGKIKQLANAFDEVKEAIGGFIVSQPALQVALQQGLDLLRGQKGALDTLTPATDKQTESWYGAETGLGVWLDGLRDGLRLVNDMAIGLDALRLSAEMLEDLKPPSTFGKAPPIQIEGISPEMRLQQEAAALLAAAIKPLTAEQKELALAFDKVGVSASKIATDFGVSEAAVKKYLEAVKTGTKDAKKSWEDYVAAALKAGTAEIEQGKKREEAIKNTNAEMDTFINTHLKELATKGQNILKLTTDETVKLSLAWMNMGPVIEGVGNDFIKALDPKTFKVRELPPEIDKVKFSIDDLQRSLLQLGSVAGGSFGMVVTGLGNIVGAAKSVKSSFGEIKEAQGLFAKGKDMEGILGMASGIAGIASAALVAVGAIKQIWGAINQREGRHAVEDFADSFGGFDALHAKLLELGDAGEALWIKLTQGVPAGNAEAAARAIAEVEAALGAQVEKQEEVTAATEEQAQATIETASQAAKALEELGPRLDKNKEEWQSWGDLVTAQIQRIADAVRALPLPGMPSAGAITAGSNGHSSANITVVSMLDGRQIAQSTARYLPDVIEGIA